MYVCVCKTLIVSFQVASISNEYPHEFTKHIYICTYIEKCMLVSVLNKFYAFESNKFDNYAAH